MTRSGPPHIIQLVNNTTSKWLHLLSSNTFAQLFFHRSTYDFLIRHGGVIVLALFMIAGIIVLEDYGVSVDEDDQHRIVNANIQLIKTGHFTDHDFHRFYGVAFELPLVLVERILQIKDIRGIHLSRHVITHIFFLVSGLFCYLLTYRMFNSRILALIAMLLFLLHPRMYAHSFFNSKDIPFLSMFMIALFLTYRAFKKDDIISFMLCGLALGVLINLRIMGLVLLAAVVAMRVLDIYQASDNSQRKHILATVAALIFITIWIFYLVTPTIWTNPLGSIMEWLPPLDQYKVVNARHMFRGELFNSIDFHLPEYIPLWASVTTPPLALVLGIIGMMSILYRCMVRPSDTLRNTLSRFGIVLIACVATPIALAIYTDANIYNGWRHVYFLYAPFCIIAIFGLHWLLSNIVSRHLRSIAYATVGAGIIATVVAMAAIHPHEQVYFNFLLDRTTPEQIRSQYDFDYWGHPNREALEYMLERYPDAPLQLWASDYAQMVKLNLEIMPRETGKRRVDVNVDAPADFYITNYREIWSGGDFEEPSDAGIYTRTIYNNTLFTILSVNPSRVQVIETPDSQEIDRTYKSAISKPPVWLSDFNLHINKNTIIYIKSPCEAEDTAERFFLYTFPVDSDDLPEHRQRLGFDNLDFNFEDRGGMLDDKCIARVHLPEYTIAAIETGQLTLDKNRTWGARIPISNQMYDSSEQ